jgi:hypothetical protein
VSLDSSVRKAAQRVIRKVGTSVIFRRVTPGVYNPATRTVGNATTDYDVKLRFDGFSDRETLAAAGSIKSGDRKGLIAAADLPIVPVPRDQVVLDELVYDVVKVDQDTAQDLAAIYVLQLRR